MNLIKTKSDLESYLISIGYTLPIPNIAVEGLIFNSEGKLILVIRSDKVRDERFKLEGIGGRLQVNDKDLQAGLQREIMEEIGQSPYDPVKVEVQIDGLLEVRIVEFKNDTTQEWVTWVVVSHLCRLMKGMPFNCEPTKHIDIKTVSLDELFNWQLEPTFDDKKKLLVPGLSKSLIEGRQVYREKYGNQPYYKNS